MNIRKFLEHEPIIHPSVFVDSMAAVIGQVELAEDVSIWPMVVLRGDLFFIKVGARSNIQDNSCLHVIHDYEDYPGGRPVVIGEDTTIGHSVTLHGCCIGNTCLIGMGSTILDGAVIEDEVIVGANSLVPPNKTLKKGFLYLGNPVKEVRPLKPIEIEKIRENARLYVLLKNQHASSRL